MSLWTTEYPWNETYFENESETDSYSYIFRLESYLVPGSLLITFIVGIIGNGIFVLMFLRNRRMRNVPNTYILSLTLASLLLIVACLPYKSILYTLPSWPWGTAVCKLANTTMDIYTGVSAFTLVALWAQRYFAIVKPTGILQTRSQTLRVTIIIWSIAFVLALPSAIFSHVYTFEFISNSVCFLGPIEPYENKYMLIRTGTEAVLYYILPVCVTAAFYVLIHSKRMERNAQITAHDEQNLSRVMLAFVIMFFICFLPYHMFNMWWRFNPTSVDDYNDFWHALSVVGFCLRFLYSCVTPVALYCMSDFFRQHFNRYLCCRPLPRGSLALNTEMLPR